MANFDDLRAVLDEERADPGVDPEASPLDLSFPASMRHSAAVADILERGAPPAGDGPAAKEVAPPLDPDTRDDIDRVVNPQNHRSSAWLGPAIAQSYADEPKISPAAVAYMRQKIAGGPGTGGSGAAGMDAPAPRMMLKHDQRIAAAPPDPTAPSVAPRDEFKAPVEDPNAVAARQNAGQRQANQMRLAQGLAGMHANESHLGNILDRAAQIMTFGDNRMGQLSPNGEADARIPVQELAAAQAKQRQDTLDADDRREKLFRQKLQEHVTKTGDLGEQRKEKQDATRDAEQSRHNKAEEAIKRAEIAALADKVANKGAPVEPNLPPQELEAIHNGVQAPDAVKDLKDKYHKIWGLGSGALKKVGISVGAQKEFDQAAAKYAPVLEHPDQRKSPAGFDQFTKETLPTGTQSDAYADKVLEGLGHDRVDEATRRAEGLAKERYNQQGVQQMVHEVAQAQAKQKAVESGGASAPKPITRTVNGETRVWNGSAWVPQ